MSNIHRSRIFPAFLLLAALSVPTAQTAKADFIVYDNGAGGPLGIVGFITDDADYGVIIADDVVLNATRTITGIQWTGAYLFGRTPPLINEFVVRIYADGSNAPAPINGNPLATFDVGNSTVRTYTGRMIGSDRVYDFSADLNFTMTGGTKYWFSVAGNSVSDPDDNFWWGMSQTPSGAYYSNDGANNWNTWQPLGLVVRTDFRLLSVPEPGALGILSLATLAALLRHRK